MKRLALVDGFRGFAALWVVAYHFYHAIADAHPLPWFQPVESFFAAGYLGVYVFFVLSGFVIACSIHRAAVDGRYVAVFAVRRSLRLDPTYWTVILLTCLLAVVKLHANLGINRSTFSAGTILLNMAYLNNLVHVRAVVPVGWTLCLEVQFYLAYILIAWLAQSLLRAKLTPKRLCLFFLPILIYSLAAQYQAPGDAPTAAPAVHLFWFPVAHGQLVPEPLLGSFVPLWCLFFLGVITWQVVAKELSAWWLLGLGLLTLAVWDLPSMVALGTAAALFLAGRFRQFQLTANWPIVQWLGRISYSLYLVHPLVGNRFLRAIMREWTGPVTGLQAVGLFAAALGVSLVGSMAVFFCVERPSHELSRRIAYRLRLRSKQLPEARVQPQT